MIIDWMRRGFALLMVGWLMGMLGACEEQSSTEQTSEATSEDARDADEATEGADETTPEPETTN